MGLCAFFCYDRRQDIQRARRVKTCWESKGGRATGFPKPDVWQKLEQKGEAALLRWIESQVFSADACVVLIGEKTSADPGIRHAIRVSHRLQKGLLGIHIHGIRDPGGQRVAKGQNPFETLFVLKDLQRIALGDLYPTYDWMADGGHFHLTQWIEKSQRSACG